MSDRFRRSGAAVLSGTAAETQYDSGTETAPRQRANAVIPRGLADWIGVD